MPEIFSKIEKIKPAYDWVYKIVNVICKLLLVADILIVSYQVLGRYVPFIKDPSWTEEVVLTLMSYMAVLSAALAIRRNAHIRMTAFDRYLPPVLIKILDLVSDFAILALSIIMLVVGWQYAAGLGAKGTYVSMPWLSRFWMYFPIAVAGIAMFVFELEAIFNHVKAFWQKDEKGGNA